MPDVLHISGTPPNSEPSEATYIEIGRLCSAWSFLEAVAETTLWGLLNVEERLGKIFTWQLDLRKRWEMILEHAPAKVDAVALDELRALNRLITIASRDRNIVVHGIVHAQAAIDISSARTNIQVPAGADITWIRVPCWTVFKGADKGKNFPISTDAVRVVRTNVQKIAHRLRAFNAQHHFSDNFTANKEIETGWPKPSS